MQSFPLVQAGVRYVQLGINLDLRGFQHQDWQGGFGEVRFQGSLATVPPGDTGPPLISNFTYNAADGSTQLSIQSAPGVRYKLVEADDLDFTNPDRNPIPLTGATVGTLDGNMVITDASGNAVVWFNLGIAKKATFVRAEMVP